MRFHALLVACAAALSGCVSTGAGGGGLIGGLGSSDRSDGNAIVEAMKGGIIATLGAELNAQDRRNALEAEYRALEHTPSGQPVIWRSSDPERYGEVVAAQPYRVGSQDCRQYTHTLHAGAQPPQPRVARGTACRNDDGSWTPLV